MIEVSQVLTIATSLAISLLIVASICDLRTREIPDAISLSLLAVGLITALGGWSVVSIGQSLLGVLLGFAVTAPLFFVGGIGGGDVKLITALGSILGTAGLFSALFWVAIAGGVLALVAKLRGQSDFAYVPAIFIGVVITCCVRGIG